MSSLPASVLAEVQMYNACQVYDSMHAMVAAAEAQWRHSLHITEVYGRHVTFTKQQLSIARDNVGKVRKQLEDMRAAEGLSPILGEPHLPKQRARSEELRALPSKRKKTGKGQI